METASTLALANVEQTLTVKRETTSLYVLAQLATKETPSVIVAKWIQVRANEGFRGKYCVVKSFRLPAKHIALNVHKTTNSSI